GFCCPSGWSSYDR
nr:RecName: Full=Snaclec convulxin subunit beta homolog [Crotalus atrox]